MPERLLKPPAFPKSIDDFKKRNTDEVLAFRDQFQRYATESGVMDDVRELLHSQQSFTNISLDEIPFRNDGKPAPKSAASQGLVVTGYEETFQTGLEVVDLNQQNPVLVDKTLEAWLFHIALFNHPEYLANLYAKAEQTFHPPGKAKNKIMKNARKEGRSLTIHDLTLTAGDAEKDRVSRTKVFANGLLVGYKHLATQFGSGREQARNIFVGGENPDVVGEPLFEASLAASHFLTGLPRDGKFKDVQNQAQLAAEAMKLMKKLANLVGRTAAEKKKLVEWYSHNLIGVLESEPEAAVKRAKVLYEQGVRTFRVYSPEPNKGLVTTVQALRKLQQQHDWQPIEVFAGQVVSVKQAMDLEMAGADALYVGVGGGGRCITGIVANLAIDWPQLIWEMRGKISIPVTVQGSANDNPATTLALGGSGIGVVGKLAGTIETPGGLLYFAEPNTDHQKFFKFYGGEASNRMRAIAGRMDPLGRTINTEGESTNRYLIAEPSQGIYPTALQFLASLEEALATGFVFQNATSIEDMHNAHSNLRLESAWGSFSRGTH